MNLFQAAFLQSTTTASRVQANPTPKHQKRTAPGAKHAVEAAAAEAGTAAHQAQIEAIADANTAVARATLQAQLWAPQVSGT